ncbi:unnamed protein product [Rhizophagus irregularis]|nr:unnamed protein product [Rhizophagus irregularis]
MKLRVFDFPVIYIDPQKARDLDWDLALQKLYYRPKGYYRTAEKMQMTCKKAGYGFTVHQSDTTPMLHDKVATQMARAIQKIYDDLNNPLSYPNTFIVDRGTKYMGECRDLLLNYNVRIQYANSKRGVAIAERDHQEFEKHAYFRQDAEDFHLPLTDRSRAWIKGLRINDDIYNNTPTQDLAYY